MAVPSRFKSTNLLNRTVAARLDNEIKCKTVRDGGVVVCVVGSKGSGKTTELLHLAENVGHVVGRKLYPDTVLWLAQEDDYWSSLDQSRVHLHNDGSILFLDEDFNDLDSPVPEDREHTYTDIYNLLQNLVPGRINVIYPPESATLSDETRDEIAQYMMQDFNTDRIDPQLWWLDLLYLYRRYKPRSQHASIIADEFGRILPGNRGAVRWWIQGWWCERELIQLRKFNISLYTSAHGMRDIDDRFHSKIQYHIYMKGARFAPESLIRGKAAVLLPVGVAFIERDGYGNLAVPNVKQKPMIRIRDTRARRGYI